MDSVRLFIAAALPEQARKKLESIERQLQRAAGESARRAVKWVPAGNIHLTLKFLGDVPSSEISALAEMLRTAASLTPAFNFSITGVGAFPNLRRPRVIWAGASAPPALFELQERIETETQRLGFLSEERSFSPHLTLGRVSQHARPEEIDLIARAVQTAKIGDVETARIDQVHLFRSELQPTGPIYTAMHSFRLSEKG